MQIILSCVNIQHTNPHPPLVPPVRMSTVHMDSMHVIASLTVHVYAYHIRYVSVYYHLLLYHPLPCNVNPLIELHFVTF